MGSPMTPKDPEPTGLDHARLALAASPWPPARTIVACLKARAVVGPCRYCYILGRACPGGCDQPYGRP